MRSKTIRQIGVLTSGGDAPGMNAAIRSITRYALYHKFQVAGIRYGYQGLIDDDIVELNHRSVSGIINRGGTILKTARSKEFMTTQGQQKAVVVLKKHRIDALIVIGGDGSYRGAHELFFRWKVPTVGLPGTIDNDLYGTDQTIGCHTAINTALESIDKIRDTAQSMERIFVVEVMGNRSGYIALKVALASGCEDVIIPEKKFNYSSMCRAIELGNRKGKVSWIIAVAEGAGKAQAIAASITRRTGLETRYVVLGHVQRGGNPSGLDRLLATRLGAAAVELIRQGQFGKAVGVLHNEINTVDLCMECQRPHRHIEEEYQLIKILT